MKEATGDMTMTIVGIISIIFILGIGRAFIWPAIKNTIINKTEELENQPTQVTPYIVPFDYNI